MLGLHVENRSFDETGRVHDVDLVDRRPPGPDLGKSVGLVDATVAEADGVEDDGITTRPAGGVGGSDGVGWGCRRQDVIASSNTEGEELEGHASKSRGVAGAGGLFLEGVLP